MSSPWIDGAVGQGGLLIPGKPRGRASDLVLTSQGLSLTVNDARADLSWALLSNSSRRIEPFFGGGAVTRGVMFTAEGELTDLVDPVRLSSIPSMPRLRRLEIQQRELDGRAVVPLSWSRVLSADQASPCRMIDLLVRVLVALPSWRERLDQPERVSELAADLRTHQLVPLQNQPLGGQRRMEIEVVLRSLKYEHRFGGRPLPGDVLPPPAQIVPDVAAAIERKPQLEHLKITDDTIQRVVETRFTAVEPWPLAALTG